MKNICDMENIHNNDINNISEFNLLHDILNNSKRTRNTNSKYYPILHVCMNTCRGMTNNRYFPILLDSEFSYMVLIRRLTTRLKPII